MESIFTFKTMEIDGQKQEVLPAAQMPTFIYSIDLADVPDKSRRESLREFKKMYEKVLSDEAPDLLVALQAKQGLTKEETERLFNATWKHLGKNVK
jgi:hypothetical protein